MPELSSVWAACAAFFWVVFYLSAGTTQLLLVCLNAYCLYSGIALSVVFVCSLIPAQWIFPDLGQGKKKW